MSKPEIIYFPFKGLAEASRICMHLGGVDFVDTRVTGEQWAAIKPTTFWGGMPIFKDGDLTLYQSNAILRYIARKFNKDLYPTDVLTASKVDMFMDALGDCRKPLIATFPDKILGTIEVTPELRKQMRAFCGSDVLPKLLSGLQLALGDSKFVAGDFLTIADLDAYQFYDMITTGFVDHLPTNLLDEMPKLKAHFKNIIEHPGVAEWITKTAN